MASIFLEKDASAQCLRILDKTDSQALGPDWASAVVQQRAFCLVAAGSVEEAEEVWEELMELYPENVDAVAQARLGLGDVHLHAGEPEDAGGWYRAALEGTTDRFYQTLALLGAARSQKALGKGDSARALYEQVVSDYADQGELTQQASDALKGGI